MNWYLAVQVILSGLAAGSIYALVGIGFGLIHRLSGVFNFAHGDLLSLGIFSFLLVAAAGGALAVTGVSPLLLLVAGVVALAIVAAIAAAMQAMVVKPFAVSGQAIGWVAGTAVAGLVLQNLLRLRFPAESYTFPEFLPLGLLPQGGTVRLGEGAVLRLRDLLVLLLGLAAALGLDRWVAWSRPGRAMRAAAEDSEAARLCGIDPQRQQVLAWILAGGMLALAGVLLAPERPVTVELGTILGLKGIACAVIGRLGSSRGAVVAGLGVGVAESVLGTVQPALHDLVAVGLLVLVLATVPRRFIPDSRAAE